MKRSPATDPHRLVMQALVAISAALVIALGLSVVVSQALADHPAASAAGGVYVRVNQVGYATGGTKRAVVLSTHSLSHASFSVAGVHGHLGRRLPRWSSHFPYAYPIDFSKLRTPGSYRIAVGSARSPSFRVGSAADIYGALVRDTHTFFAAQRDGPVVDSSVLNRQPSHLADESASVYDPPSSARALSAGQLKAAGQTADVSGGWFDAGDYMKFAETGSFADALVLMAVRDHPAASALASDARFETDWLLKLWDPSRRELIYQVGLGDGDGTHVLGDHDLWRLPQVDDTLNAPPGSKRFYERHRPAFRQGAPGARVSPNLAGRLAADYALCAQVFQASDGQLASRCLVAAQTVYGQARTAGNSLTTTSPRDYYPESEWRDDMELGAAEIYRAMANGFSPPGLVQTNPIYYLHQSAHWANEYLKNASADSDSLNLYDVSGVAHPELIAAMRQAASAGFDVPELQVSVSELLGDLHTQLANGVRLAARDSFGLADPFGQSDSVPHALGYAIEAHRYAASGGGGRFSAFASEELDWVLGANAWGSSFVVGAGSSFPRCVAHQVANLSGSLDGRPPLLLGATVDGPNDLSSIKGLEDPEHARRCSHSYSRFNSRRAGYIDSIASPDTSEPGIDYTSLAALAFADQT